MSTSSSYRIETPNSCKTYSPAECRRESSLCTWRMANRPEAKVSRDEQCVAMQNKSTRAISSEELTELTKRKQPVKLYKRVRKPGKKSYYYSPVDLLSALTPHVVATDYTSCYSREKFPREAEWLSDFEKFSRWPLSRLAPRVEHRLNPTKVQEWLNLLPPGASATREGYKEIFADTRFISFREFHANLVRALQKFVDFWRSPNAYGTDADTTPFILLLTSIADRQGFSGEEFTREKSNFWATVLANKWLQEQKLTYAVTSLEQAFEVCPDVHDIVIVDDAIYSGDQMVKRINSICTRRWPTFRGRSKEGKEGKEENSPVLGTNFHIITAFATADSTERFKRIYPESEAGQPWTTDYPSPCAVRPYVQLYYGLLQTLGEIIEKKKLPPSPIAEASGKYPVILSHKIPDNSFEHLYQTGELPTSAAGAAASYLTLLENCEHPTRGLSKTEPPYCFQPHYKTLFK